MTEHGLYVVKREFLELVTSLGGVCDVIDGDKRPIYCCIKDNKIDGLYWAIPTSDLNHRSEEQIQKYERYMQMPDDDLRSSYYHIGRTTIDALYKVSSCFPITDEYIDHEYTSCGEHVVIRRAETVAALERKLRKILAFESRRPNYFSQRITDIKKHLIQHKNNT